MGIPIVDIAALREADGARRALVVAALGEACREIGFFAIVGHGIPQALIGDVFDGARRLFALPGEEKHALRGDMMDGNRGYVPLGGERLNAGLPPDRKEAFNIGLDPSVALSGSGHARANIWPEIPHWRETMLAYFDQCRAVGARLHEAFADILGVERDFFAPALASPAAVLRLLHYPGGAQHSAGAGEHTDYGNITILATDGVGGLEVRDRRGNWIAVPGIAGGFICNIGDCLMRWTNDLFVSTPHRVVAPPAERYSVAFFLDADPEALVEPIVTAQTGAARYPPILSGDLIRSRLRPTYAHVGNDD